MTMDHNDLGSFTHRGHTDPGDTAQGLYQDLPMPEFRYEPKAWSTEENIQAAVRYMQSRYAQREIEYCIRCAYDLHKCASCGDELPHGVEVCIDCTAIKLADEESIPPPSASE